MKRVLIITYYWPPAGGAGVQRWLKFSKYLPANGWTPVIFTPDNPEYPAIDETLVHDIPVGTEVIRRPIREPYKFYKFFAGRKNEAIKPGFITNTKGSRWKEKLSVWIRGNIFIPDPKISWVKPSIKYLHNYLSENKIDMVITSGPPHSMHLIGLGLKRKTGIKWVADFRDPWSGIDYYKDLMLTTRSDRKHKRLEKSVLMSADEVITVGNGCANNLKSLSERNINIIYNGFDRPDMANDADTDSEKFRIVHTGALNRDRNPLAFFEAIKRLIVVNPLFLERVEIRLVGMVDAAVMETISSLSLEKVTVSTGYLSHPEAINEMKRASLLLLPVNRTSGSSMIVTGKVFEYLATGKPVICICDEKSELRSIIPDNDSYGCFGFEESNEIEEFIRRQFEAFISGKASTSSLTFDLYSRENLTKDLALLLNRLAD